MVINNAAYYMNIFIISTILFEVLHIEKHLTLYHMTNNLSSEKLKYGAIFQHFFFPQPPPSISVTLLSILSLVIEAG
jgi:hypothetical protein